MKKNKKLAIIFGRCIDAPLEKAAKGDELAATVNYETIYQVCRLEMDQPSKLLEHVARRIIDVLFIYVLALNKFECVLLSKIRQWGLK